MTIASYLLFYGKNGLYRPTWPNGRSKNQATFFQLCLTVLLLSSGGLIAEEIRVAAASNFSQAIKHLADQFQSDTGNKVTLIFGSTGKHYAQIKNGAPFDVYFAADARRPKLLETEGEAIADSRFTYAIGRLVLWSPQPDYIDPQGQVLEHANFRFLSIANPKLAPYGKAAREALQARKLWGGLQERMIRGENIGQAFQFVNSGNAELGFVAYSQIKRPDQTIRGSWWEVPQTLYSPIKQQAILLNDTKAARLFLDYIKSPQARLTIQEFGYDTP